MHGLFSCLGFVSGISMQNTAVRFHPTNSRTLCSPLGFLGQHVRLFTLSDACGSLQYMCHLGPTIISRWFLCRKDHGRFVPVAPWDFAETKPLHTSVFPGETRARCRKVVYKKNREKTRNFPKWLKSPKG